MKKISVLLAGVLCATSIGAGAAAAGVIREIKAELRPDFTIEVDGKKQTFRNANGDIVEPILYEGTTYLPLRAIGELMGKTVYWYEDEKRIDLKTPEEPKGPTVTDADVIVQEGDKVKPEKTEKTEKAEKAEKTKQDKEKPENSISEDEAKKIALDKAGFTESEVRFERVEQDRENGVWVYDVEFQKDRREYSAEIDMETGEILSWDVDYDD